MMLDAAFLKLHADLPRLGVGSDWSTEEALNRLPPLRKPASVMDLGCGPGRQTIQLARRFQSPVIAVDESQSLLDQMQETAMEADLADLVVPRCQSLVALDDPPASRDLLWSEGRLDRIGWETGLSHWAPLLRPRGILAVSARTWLTEIPPAEAVQFWNEHAPAMATIEDNIRRAEAAGLRAFDHFILPRSAQECYYAPLRRRLHDLDGEAPGIGGAVATLKAEIAVHDRYGDSFGQVFYLLRLN